MARGVEAVSNSLSQGVPRCLIHSDISACVRSPSHGAVRQLGLLSLFILIFRLKKDDIHICGLIQLN